MTQERYKPEARTLEKSVIEYDKYGRQVKRTDCTNRGVETEGVVCVYFEEADDSRVLRVESRFLLEHDVNLGRACCD